jgi:hypothetical protein
VPHSRPKIKLVPHPNALKASLGVVSSLPEPQKVLPWLIREVYRVGTAHLLGYRRYIGNFGNCCG